MKAHRLVTAATRVATTTTTTTTCRRCRIDDCCRNRNYSNTFTRLCYGMGEQIHYLQQQQQQKQQSLSISSTSLSRSRSENNNSSSNNTFDTKLKILQRTKAALLHKKWQQNMNGSNNDNNTKSSSSSIITYDYFHEEMAERLIDRLDDIKRSNGFPLALDIGSGPGYIYKAICADDFIYNDSNTTGSSDNNDTKQEGPTGGIGGVRKLVQLDSCYDMLHRDDDNNDNTNEQQQQQIDGSYRCDTYKLHIDDYDENVVLPFPDNTFDLVISSLTFHNNNNLLLLFNEINRILQPDGCFMFNMIGDSSSITLSELRSCIILSELERQGGIGVHVGPYINVSDIGSLLQQCNFTLPTIDVDTITLSYPNSFILMEHIQRMGESNACIYKKHTITKDVLLATACLYDHLFPLQLQDESTTTNNTSTTSTNTNNEIEASIQILFAIGWKPHPKQQQPKQRGTATHRVGEIVVDQTTASSSNAKQDANVNTSTIKESEK